MAARVRNMRTKKQKIPTVHDNIVDLPLSVSLHAPKIILPPWSQMPVQQLQQGVVNPVVNVPQRRDAQLSAAEQRLYNLNRYGQQLEEKDIENELIPYIRQLNERYGLGPDLLRSNVPLEKRRLYKSDLLEIVAKFGEKTQMPADRMKELQSSIEEDPRLNARTQKRPRVSHVVNLPLRVRTTKRTRR
jgi:hypothetical protein